MDINTNNNLSSISNAQSSSLEKISTGLAINKASDNSSSLSIAENIDNQRSTMHQALENVNSGIAMSAIAQGGLKEQSKILDEINTLSIQAMTSTTSMQGKEAIKNEISALLDSFDAVASRTTYNGTELLSGEEQDLSIVVDGDSLINMQSQDTVKVSDRMRSYLGDFTMDTEAMTSLFDANSLGMDAINEFATAYSSSSNAMVTSGRSSLAQETTMAEANSTILETDYSKEVSDFSKTNIMAQIGMLASTQANAMQQKNVSLLS